PVRGRPPLSAEQVVRYALEGGSAPPARLADLIALRVDNLEPRARRVLQAIAVLGARMLPDTLAELLPKTEQLDAAIEALLRAGMVELVGGTIGTTRPLLRQIVIAGIPVAVQRQH